MIFRGRLLNEIVKFRREIRIYSQFKVWYPLIPLFSDIKILHYRE